MQGSMRCITGERMSAGSIALAALCTIVGAVFGAVAGNKYIERERVLNEFMRLCKGLSGDIAYSHEPVKILMQKHKERLKTLDIYIDGFLGVLDTGLDTDDTTLREHVPKGCLSDDEYDLVISMMGELGKSTAQFQREGLNSVLAGLEVKHEEALIQSRKYGKLYSKLGLLAGIAVGIIVL